MSLSYINKHGGTRSLPLLNLATEVWNWCLQRNIIIQVQHIKGVHNTIADMESRRTFFKIFLLRPSVPPVQRLSTPYYRGNGCYPFGYYPVQIRISTTLIIEPFTIHPHAHDFELCPVQCFKVLRDHPALVARPFGSHLFVKSNNVSEPLVASTISSWLHRDFSSLCTDESGVSLRSLASSRALDLGVSQADIVTLGNWASSATFQDHYQRNHMANVDFTSLVLSGSDSDEFSMLKILS